MKVGVSQSRHFLMFLSEGLMTRPFCIKEQRWAIQYNCNIVGVMEIDPRHGKVDINKERAKAPKDLVHLLTEIEFMEYMRREFLLKALIDEICERGHINAATRGSSQAKETETKLNADS